MKIHVLTKTCECSHQLYSQQVQNTYNPKMFIMIMVSVVYSHSRILYSAIEKKAVLTQATTWVNLENIMLKEVRYTKGHII